MQTRGKCSAAIGHFSSLSAFCFYEQDFLCVVAALYAHDVIRGWIYAWSKCILIAARGGRCLNHFTSLCASRHRPAGLIFAESSSLSAVCLTVLNSRIASVNRAAPCNDPDIFKHSWEFVHAVSQRLALWRRAGRWHPLQLGIWTEMFWIEKLICAARISNHLCLTS